VSELSSALCERGVAADVLRPDPGFLALADRLLSRRGFTGPLAAVPPAVGALLAARYDLAHSFTATDALAALAWRRVTKRPVVHTCLEPVERAGLADRRLRLSLLRRSVEDTDAVLAPSRETQEALLHWLLVEATLLPPDDGASHERLYRELVAGTPKLPA
jgi:hypothetical protein